MITIIISTLAWILSAILDAYVQGYYYALYPSDKGHKNLHPYFVAIRAILLSMILWNNYFTLDNTLLTIFGLCLCMTYSFFHNGVYYWIRHKLDNKVYPKGFWDSSVTSEATFEIGTGMRTGLAIVGLVGIYLIIISI